MKLLWDGSYLGNFGEKIIKSTWEIEKRKYMKISIKKHIFFCAYITPNSSFACVVDELKPLFGLTKIGSHRINIDRKMYIIYYVPYVDTIQWETPLQCIPANHKLRKNKHIVREIKKIIIFRNIMALRANFERNIILRKVDHDRPIEEENTTQENIILPISVGEEHHILEKAFIYDSSVLRANLIRAWFNLEPLEKCLKTMISYRENDHTVMIRLRYAIEEIITRVDKDYIWFSKNIIERTFRVLKV